MFALTGQQNRMRYHSTGMGHHLSSPGLPRSMPSAPLSCTVMALAFSRGYTYFRGIKSYRVTVTQVHHYSHGTSATCKGSSGNGAAEETITHLISPRPGAVDDPHPSGLGGRSSSLQARGDGSSVESATSPIPEAWDRAPRDASLCCPFHPATHRCLFGRRDPSPGFWLFLSLPSAEVPFVLVRIWYGVIFIVDDLGSGVKG
ncbi:hypothetical protein QBC39DRAFT_165421 [Podospora conica]|nr:hypothetical protein QBC39DRAFT_165421 [Schizothecium conicum]